MIPKNKSFFDLYKDNSFNVQGYGMFDEFSHIGNAGTNCRCKFVPVSEELKVAISGDFSIMKGIASGGVQSGGHKISDKVWKCLMHRMRKLMCKPSRGKRWNRRVEKLMFQWGYRKIFN